MFMLSYFLNADYVSSILMLQNYSTVIEIKASLISERTAGYSRHWLDLFFIGG